MPLNTKSPGVRRILEEAKEIQADPSADFVASPSEENVFDWYPRFNLPINTKAFHDPWASWLRL